MWCQRHLLARLDCGFRDQTSLLGGESGVLKLARGGTTFVWPNPFPQACVGGGSVALAVINVADVVRNGPPVAIAVFTTMFLILGYMGVRFLLVRVQIGDDITRCVGFVRCVRIHNRDVQRVHVIGAATPFPQCVVECAGVGSVTLPMALNGSLRSVERLAQLLDERLVPDLSR